MAYKALIEPLLGALWFLGDPKESTKLSSEKQRFHADAKLFGNPEDSKTWSSKNTKIPRGFNVMGNGQYVSKHNFDVVSFMYVFGLFTIIQDLLRFRHRKTQFFCFFENARRSQLFLTYMLNKRNSKDISSIWCPIVNIVFSCSEMLWSVKIIGLMMSGIFLVFFEVFLSKIRGVRGQIWWSFWKFQNWSKKYWNMSGDLK